MSDQLRSILLGTAGLSVAAAIALLLTLVRGGMEASGPELRLAVRLAFVTTLVQAGHFAEELATGFHWRFPELLGLSPWSLRFFVSFNLVWLAVWGLSLWGLAERRRSALFPFWFLGIAGVVNGLAHPALSLRTGGYFPGLVTSPLMGVAGIVLLRQLGMITKPGHQGRGSASQAP
jgi:hypothetical protein